MAFKIGRWTIRTVQDLPSADEMHAIASGAKERFEKEEVEAAILDICDKIRKRATYGYTSLSIFKDDLDGMVTPVARLAELCSDKLTQLGYDVVIPGYEMLYMKISWDQKQEEKIFSEHI